ncbi:MAG: hypothetical protein NUV47_01250 [Patescibacteria group bacterium]|nr:hypothetical protein [Patescibacteria group bacterium]
MIIILCCSFLIILGIIILRAKFFEDAIVGGLLIILPGIVLSIALILIPMQRMCIYSEIKQFQIAQETISNARKNGLTVNTLTIENVAILQKIIDANKWLVNAKYWKTTIFSLWIPDEINNLSEIK